MLPIDLRPICVSLTRIKKHKAMAICVVAATRLFYSTSSMAEWLRCQAAECKVHSSIPTLGACRLSFTINCCMIFSSPFVDARFPEHVASMWVKAKD